MKCRKLKAVLAVVSAIAVLATAMTGFAAITTTTEYTIDAGTPNVAKVKSIVDAVEGAGQYSLLVKGTGTGVDGNGTLFLFQQSATEFNYKISTDPAVIGNSPLEVTVTSGNKTGSVQNGTLGVAAKVDNYSDSAAYTIELAEDVSYVGTEVLNVKFVPAAGYQIDKVATAWKEKVEGVERTVSAEHLHTFNWIGVPFVNGEIDDDTSDGTGFTCSFSEVDTDIKLDNVNKITVAGQLTTVMKVVGNPTRVGVIYNNTEYMSMAPSDAKYVAITLKNESEEAIAEADVTPYYYVANAEGEGGTYYYADGTVMQ